MVSPSWEAQKILTDIRRRQGGRIVYAVTDLGNNKSLRFQLADNPLLILRHQFCLHLNAQLLADCLRRPAIIARQHHNLDAGIGQSLKLA